MPLTRLRCCDQLFDAEELLKHVEDRNNQCQWTYELLAAMVEANVAHPSHDDPSRISTTTLVAKCLRSETLKRSRPYVEDVESLYASFRGTAVHAQLASHIKPGAYGEVRFHIDDLRTKIDFDPEVLDLYDDWSFSGSPDLVDPTAGVLYDYKRSKEVPRFDKMWPDHAQQLQINRWLIDHADWVELADGSVFNRGDEAFDALLPIEWQELIIVYIDDKGPKPIAAWKSIDIPKRDGKGTKKARVPDIWSDEDVEDFIAKSYPEAREAFTIAIAPIPDGWENQSHVLCGYCPMRRECAALERNGE